MLTKAIGEGNRYAFEAFYRMEHDNLVHFVSGYSRDKSLAEDIVQDTFLRIWQRRFTLDPDGNPRALAFTIARNLILDTLRSRKDTVSIEACRCLEDSSLDSLIEALDLAALIGKTIDKLPAKIRRTFLLSRESGLRNKEIAEKEKVSVKAVEYRISTALKKLYPIKKL